MLVTKIIKNRTQARMRSATSRECYLGLGSNLYDPGRQIQIAYRFLSARPEFSDCLCSALYGSRAMTADNKQQPDYVNAVARLRTRLDPYQLLELTQAIERRMGRRKESPRWRARIIDIDILLMQGLRLQDPQLTLPHSGLLRRPFVLYPLAEIAPQLILDHGKRAAACAAEVEDHWRTRKLPRLDDPRRHKGQRHAIRMGTQAVEAY